MEAATTLLADYPVREMTASCAVQLASAGESEADSSESEPDSPAAEQHEPLKPYANGATEHSEPGAALPCSQSRTSAPGP